MENQHKYNKKVEAKISQLVIALHVATNLE